MAAPDIESYAFGKEYTSFVADINLETDENRGKHASEIKVIDAGSGTLALEFSDGTTATFTAVTAGEKFFYKVSKILLATDVAKVRASWT